MGATHDIAEFITRTTWKDFPADAHDKAKKVIADTFAVVLAGAGSEVAGPLLQYAGPLAESGATPLLGTGLAAAPETAALVNGTFGHALDYDDVLSMMPAHPSAVILAAVLSTLDGQRIDGDRLIEAYVIGIEVGGKIGLGMTTGHYHRGFHATGTLALFSAVAALAKLHELDVPATEQTFGIAASMSSGLRRNFGTMTKPLHSGLAARSAVTALRLATAGFTAAPDIFEAKSGFFSTYGTNDSDADVTVAGLGRPFVVSDPGIALKKFPCCYATHRGIDGMLALRTKLGADAASLDKVVCRMPPGGMQVLTYPRPVTGLEGKFSMPYTLATSVLDGACVLASFTDAAVRRPHIMALYDRIEAYEDPACRGDDPRFETRSSGSRGFVEVELRMKNGRSDRIRIDKPPGAPSRDLTWDELQVKFIDCARETKRVSDQAAGDAFAALQSLERLDDIGRVTSLLR